jgi:hypothetical protein
MVAIGAAAGALLNRSNQDNGFFNTGYTPNIQYLWTILPTLVVEALTIYVKGSDHSIRALAPFAALQSRRDTFERALAISYTTGLDLPTFTKLSDRGVGLWLFRKPWQLHAHCRPHHERSIQC